MSTNNNLLPAVLTVMRESLELSWPLACAYAQLCQLCRIESPKLYAPSRLKLTDLRRLWLRSREQETDFERKLEWAFVKLSAFPSIEFVEVWAPVKTSKDPDPYFPTPWHCIECDVHIGDGGAHADCVTGARWTGSDVVQLRRANTWKLMMSGSRLPHCVIEIPEPFELQYPYATNWLFPGSLLISSDYPASLELKWCISRNNMMWRQQRHMQRGFAKVLRDIREHSALLPQQ